MENANLYVAVAQAALCKVLLVIVLSTIKGLRGDNLCDDTVLKMCLGGLLRGFGCSLLLRRMEEDYGTILRADVRALTIFRSRIV